MLPSRFLSVSSVLVLSTAAACSSAPPPAAEETAASTEGLSRRKACAADDQCSASEYCDTEAGAGTCGAGGHCASRGETSFCPEIDEQLCGCDGVVYPNACIAHKAGMSIDQHPFHDTDVTDHTLEHRPFTDTDQTYFYTFETHGRFSEHTEPPCTRTEPHCEIAVDPLTGTFTKHGATVELDYANGNVAYFDAQEDCKGTWQLVGKDFGAQLTLRVTTLDP